MIIPYLSNIKTVNLNSRLLGYDKDEKIGEVDKKPAILGEKRGFLGSEGDKKEVKVVGLEPTTHGLKGRCPNHITHDKQSTSELPPNDLAQNLALLLQKYPDLAGLIEAWPNLPEPVKAGILAMVDAAGSHKGAIPE